MRCYPCLDGVRVPPVSLPACQPAYLSVCLSVRCCPCLDGVRVPSVGQPGGGGEVLLLLSILGNVELARVPENILKLIFRQSSLNNHFITIIILVPYVYQVTPGFIYEKKKNVTTVEAS